MPKRSAGILLYRRRSGTAEVLLVHPGGPFWAHKDDGAWSVPKGIYEEDEDPLAAAKREFAEETGGTAPNILTEIGAFTLTSGKILRVWAGEGAFDPAALTSNTCAIEWPPRSGRQLQIPEVDRAEWFAPAVAMQKISKGQQQVLVALWRQLGIPNVAS